MSTPLVTIITPCHNNADTIVETINSVRIQTFNDWEMIIVDDSSVDKSLTLIKKIADIDPRIKYYSTDAPSGSPALPRNIGIEKARGKYIAFLDADDQWYPEKLAIQVAFAEKTGLPFLYSDYEKMDEDGARSNRLVYMPGKTEYKDLLRTNSIPCLTVFLTREAIGEHRFKDVPREDCVLWLEILKEGNTAFNVGKVLALYRQQRKSRSSNKWAMMMEQWNMLREMEHLSVPKALSCLTHYLYYGFKKYLK